MKKKIMTILLAMTMLSTMAMPAFTAPQDTEMPDDGIIEPRYAVLKEVQCSSPDGNQLAYEFTTTPGNGDDIRYWFNNTGSSYVNVKLQKTGANSSWTTISEQNYAPGESWYKTYTGGGKVTRKYRVVVSADGHEFYGQLRVAQV